MVDFPNICLEGSDEAVLPSPQGLKVFAITLIILVCLSTTCLVSLFMWRRSRFAILRARSLFFLYTMVAAALYGLVLPYDVAADGGVPCFILGHSLLLFFSPMIVINLADTMLFYFKVKLSRALSTFELTSAVTYGADVRIGQLENPISRLGENSLTNLKNLLPAENEQAPAKKSTKKRIFCLNFQNKTKFRDFEAERNPSGLQGPLGVDYTLNQENFPPAYLFWFSSDWFALGIVIFACLLSAALVPVAIGEHDTCLSPCVTFDFDARLTAALALITSQIGIYFICSIKDEPDPLKLKMDLLLSISVGVIFGLPGYIFYEVNPGYSVPDFKHHWLLLWVVSGWFQVLIRFGKPLWDSYKEEKLLNSGVLDLTLEDVLKTATGRNMFKAFLVTEFCVENYLFWREVKDYNFNFDERSIEENRSLRAIIAELYIGDNAKLQVNIAGNICENVKGKLSSPPQRSDFEEAFVEVFRMMSNDSFTRFRQSHYYRSLVWDDVQNH